MPEPQFFDQKTYAPTHGPARANHGAAGATYDQVYQQGQTDAINAILAALRSAGIISQNP